MDPLTVQRAATALGIDCPYVARVAGRRVEFHLPSGRVLLWSGERRAYDRPTLQTLDVDRLVELAGRYRIARRTKMRKAELIEAILARMNAEEQA